MKNHVGLAWMVTVLVTACAPVKAELVYRRTTPRAVNCQLVFVHNGMLDGKPFIGFTTHERLGTVVVREDKATPEVTAEVSRRACAMGGDTVTFEDVVHTRIGLIDMSSDLTFEVLRTLTQAELDVRTATALALLGVTDAKVVEKAAFDHDCPVAQVKLVRKREEATTGDYVLDVCGSERRYSRLGVAYKAVIDVPAPSTNVPAPSTNVLAPSAN
jgi:hypothetical protein